MLLQIRNYLRQETVASNQQMARAFAMDLHALQPLLDFWQGKGVIIPCETNASCKSACFKCKLPPVYYRMVLS